MNVKPTDYRPSSSQKIDSVSYQVGGNHYVKRKIQPWEIWKAYEMNPWEANALKYLLRYKDKGKPLEDLKKCRHYIEFLINTLEEEDVQDKSREWTHTYELKAGFPHI